MDIKKFLAIYAILFVQLVHADFSTVAPKLPKKNAPSKSATPLVAPSSFEKSESTSSTGAAAGTGLFSDDVSKHNTEAPVSYKALKMQGVRGGIIELMGDVNITQDTTNLVSDKAQVFPDAKTNRPVRALALGNVKIKKNPTPNTKAIRAIADEVEIFFETKKAQLRGNPKIWRGDEELVGKVMDLDLITGQVQIASVSGVFDPEANRSVEKEKDSKKESKTKTKGKPAHENKAAPKGSSK